jgi:hypothetical protein
MAHFLTVVPILIIGVYTAGMFFVVFRFFSPSLNEHPNRRLRTFLLWMFVGGPLLITVGFSLEQLFPLFTSFWLAIPVIILFIGGLVIFSQTRTKQERQPDQDGREPGKLIQKQPQPKETREEE